MAVPRVIKNGPAWYGTTAGWSAHADEVLPSGVYAIRVDDGPPFLGKLGNGVALLSELNWSTYTYAGVIPPGIQSARNDFFGVEQMTEIIYSSPDAYDPSGSAASAESNANSYTDVKVAALTPSQATVATTDSTQTTIATIAVSSGVQTLIQATVTAKRTGGASGAAGDGAEYIIRGHFTNVSGTATLVSQATNFTSESQTDWDTSFGASGANALIRVTGAASNNISWRASYFKEEL